MNRSLKLSMLVALALGSTHAMALDLGQVQVKSTLGQPLLAEIPLHPANPGELKGLSVQLASSEAFARAGIVEGRTTIPLQFNVTQNASGQPVIRITSASTVDNPYLDLLLEVKSSAGSSVREFAILLDPPGSSEASPAVAAAPAPAAAPVVRKPASPAPAQTAPKSSGAAPATPAIAGTEPGKIGPVQRGQTLMAIARSAAPAGVDVGQMMLALKQANPDAFYRDNINALKSGAVLRVPSASEARSMTVAAAMAEVQRQNSDWRAGPAAKPALLADAGTRASTSSSPSRSGGEGDRLALLPPKAAGGSTAGVGAAGKGDKHTQQELLHAQESLASAQQQSNDLKTRLNDLTDINNKNQRLLSLKDSQIAELQRELADARKGNGATPAAAGAASAVTGTAAAPAAAATPTAATPTAAASTPAAASAMVAATAGTVASAGSVAAASAAPMAAPAVAASVKPVAPAVVKPKVAPAAPVVEAPWYMQTWAWAAAAGAVLVLLLLALLGRRKKAPLAARSPPSLADSFVVPPVAADGADDVDQNELLDQLAEHPDDIYLHLELVTLYYSRRDVDHFEAAAEAMHAHITDPQQDEWQDVVHMGEDLAPGHPLFATPTAQPLHDESATRAAFDIDDYAAEAPAAAPPMPPMPTQPKPVSEYHYNFDLTGPHAAHPSAEHDDPAPFAAPPTNAAEPLLSSQEAMADWRFDEAADTGAAFAGSSFEQDGFSDDPIDTKLDLARAYLDMGDADGARAMLDEVLKEGSQMQQDTARRLLETLN